MCFSILPQIGILHRQVLSENSLYTRQTLLGLRIPGQGGDSARRQPPTFHACHPGQRPSFARGAAAASIRVIPLLEPNPLAQAA